MATLILTVEGETIGSATVTTTLTKVESDRLTAYLAAMHGVDAEGNPRDLEGMVRAYWAGVVQGTAANVERHEREAAAQAARDAVGPLVYSVA
ncbi:hypothetical protein [Jannaschia formosa]|uniref:hypothetical protein n=1 Tax=Jannaschia formosa TaxID=2259592 RepID=UPI001074D62F|nr:hypothetical protein [Jannaschia formosa]TFL16453.1 hypothetical protein DR046_20240 [Jannaschia formosa]